MGVSINSTVTSVISLASLSRDQQTVLVSVTSNFLFFLPGPGQSEAESERGVGEAAGPAGALQEVFDTAQHSLGQRTSQLTHPEGDLCSRPSGGYGEGGIGRRSREVHVLLGVASQSFVLSDRLHMELISCLVCHDTNNPSSLYSRHGQVF